MTEPADPLAIVAEAARQGDAVATQRLLRAVGPAVLGVARALLGRADSDLEDVVQDALVGVIKALPAFRGESSVKHFARSIAVRRALGHRRSGVLRATMVELEDDAVVATGETAYQTVLAVRRRVALRKLLEELPPEQAEALGQRVLFGFSNEEIATQMNAPVETVRSRLRLAKSALRERIRSDATLVELLETGDDEA